MLASIGYGLVFLGVAARLPVESRLRAAVVAVALVDRSGAASIIKPLGLAFPAALALCGAALLRTGAGRSAFLVLAAALTWPVAHVSNLGPLAVAVNLALLVGLGSLAWPERTERSSATYRSTDRVS